MINDFTKVAEYKIILQKSVALLCINIRNNWEKDPDNTPINNTVKNRNKNKIGTHIVKKEDLYNGNFKSMKKIV